MNTTNHVADLSIKELRDFLEERYPQNKLLFYKNIVSHTISDNFQNSIHRFYSISDIRLESPFYRGMDNETHDIVPSIKRLYGKHKQYSLLNECKYINSLIKLPFINEKNISKISIDLLARMQHYNFKSRLVDITFNYAVAIYMAACSDYLTNGKVIEFIHKSNKKTNEYSNIIDRFHYMKTRVVI